jgi:hypothetical protein
MHRGAGEPLTSIKGMTVVMISQEILFLMKING